MKKILTCLIFFYSAASAQQLYTDIGKIHAIAFLESQFYSNTLKIKELTGASNNFDGFNGRSLIIIQSASK